MKFLSGFKDGVILGIYVKFKGGIFLKIYGKGPGEVFSSTKAISCSICFSAI